MLENRPVLKLRKDGKDFEFLCPVSCTWAELFDVLSDMKGFSYEQMKDGFEKEAEMQAKQKSKEIKLVEPEVEDV